ncbi:MAG TPA: ABC transporter permease [Candidatus Faecalibacterium intestinipullorum]|uniref:Peptide ABC transporter permease n=1 Tax=Faecalibacterium gallinarum TaxID=2903556 RepID=A0AA37J0A1_9FIRM|nr:ABC transporter permease [Faecalibacterium gallinarum]GJN65179.1 peptide ABC transporter permease [Faecalibacterium gallinarum]HIV51418.1 ABC transporter permease [Candidatus Faecalibacterium intestinipullorum]
MFKYTVKRLLQSLITILLAVTVVFLLLRMLPTDYYFTEDQLMKFTPEQKNSILEAAGLLDPVGEQLVRFYGQILHLDFGTSRRIQSGIAVTKVIGSKFGVSMRLGVISLAISLFLGVILGILQTVFKDRVIDHFGTAYTVFVNAVPALVSYSLVLVFGSKVLGLPALYSTRNVTMSSILPIACLSLASIAGYALWTRRYMVDELTRDYIKLAKIKGLNTRQIMLKHVLRNAMVPMVQYIPASFLLTIGGSLLVERFFSVPGMGPLLTDAINRYDVNVVQTLVMFYAALGIVGVFLGDVLMMLVDPRITLTEKGGTR